MVLVVGPSGAGKDTLIEGLKQRLRDHEKVHFARRVITREADPDAEDHDVVSFSDFENMTRAGDVALSWQAHDLGYVIPKSCDHLIAKGHTVIANGSRRILKQSDEKYETSIVLLITAPIDVLATRLAARGRETAEEVAKRLKRADLEPEDVPSLVRIENTGTVEEGVDAMVKALELV